MGQVESDRPRFERCIGDEDHVLTRLRGQRQLSFMCLDFLDLVYSLKLV